MIEFVRDNTLAVALLVGLLLPLVTAVIQQPGWSKKTRSAVVSSCPWSPVSGPRLLVVTWTGAVTRSRPSLR